MDKRVGRVLLSVRAALMKILLSVRPALIQILLLEIWGRAQREAARGVRKQALVNF